MRLLKYENYEVAPTPEALMLKPFRKLWKRDRSKSKDRALSELAFIYFYADPRSEYQIEPNDEARAHKLAEVLGLGPSWKPDETIVEATNLYTDLTETPATLLLKDTEETVERFRTHLKYIDFDATDDKGKKIYPLNQVAATLKQIPDIIDSLSKARRNMYNDLDTEDNVRGQATKNIYEDGIDPSEFL